MYDTLRTLYRPDVTRVATVVSTLSVIYISRVFFFSLLARVAQGFGCTRRHTYRAYTYTFSGEATFFFPRTIRSIPDGVFSGLIYPGANASFSFSPLKQRKHLMLCHERNFRSLSLSLSLSFSTPLLFHTSLAT